MTGQTTPGPEKWVPEAVAQQEEHIRRQSSCEGRLYVSHSWDTFSPRPGVFIQACWRCKVTRTDADYQTKLRAVNP